MELLDIYLPHYHFRERHTLDIRATAAEIMAAVERYDSTQDRFVRAMTLLREMPQRLIWMLGDAPARNRPPFSLGNFTDLGTIPDRALALGLAGRFWKLDYGQETVPDAETFVRFKQPGADVWYSDLAPLNLGTVSPDLSRKHVCSALMPAPCANFARSST